jgi:hypothetical protein
VTALPLGKRLTATSRAAGDTTVVAVLAVFLAFSLNFGAYRVFGDGVNYYAFTQRLFGDTSGGTGYNFGVGLMNAPFYTLAKAGSVVVGHAAKLERASITLASISWVLLAALLSWRVLVRLDLPGRALAIAVATFGTPVWYYASLSPASSHAADAATFALAAWALLLVWSSSAVGWQIAAGTALGLGVTVRPFNVGVAAGAVLALAAFRKFRAAAIVAACVAATYLLLASIPFALGLSFTKAISGQSVSGNSLAFAPLSPIRMLFTNHRGLFVWTPATLLAVIGLGLLLRRHPARGFLTTLAAMGAGLLAMNVGLKSWDAGWSYSARYLASPLTLYAVGISGLIFVSRGAARAAVVAAAALCTAWSLLIGMNHAFGALQSDGAWAVATKRTPTEFLHQTWAYSRIRHLLERT